MLNELQVHDWVDKLFHLRRADPVSNALDLTGFGRSRNMMIFRVFYNAKFRKSCYQLPAIYLKFIFDFFLGLLKHRLFDSRSALFGGYPQWSYLLPLIERGWDKHPLLVHNYYSLLQVVTQGNRLFFCIDQIEIVVALIFSGVMPSPIPGSTYVPFFLFLLFPACLWCVLIPYSLIFANRSCFNPKYSPNFLLSVFT